jgi:hypothetical protein
VIAGYFDPSFSRPLPKVKVAVRLPKITRDWAVVRFVLDTGAARTAIHPLEATNTLGIDPAALRDPGVWPRSVKLGGISGGLNTYYLVPAEYAFVHTDGQLQTIQAEIRIAQPTPSNEKVASLLGWDLLERFQVCLDWTQKQITLK